MNIRKFCLALGVSFWGAAGVSVAFAHGVIAVCAKDPNLFATASNYRTQSDAEDAAMWVLEKATGCRPNSEFDYHRFWNTCAAFVVSPSTVTLFTGRLPEYARAQAEHLCTKSGSNDCTAVAVLCDGGGTPVTALSPDAERRPPIRTTEPAPSKTEPLPPMLAESKSDGPSKEAAVTEPQSPSAERTLPLSDYWRAYLTLAARDVADFFDFDELKAVSLVAATVAVLGLVVLHIASLGVLASATCISFWRNPCSASCLFASSRLPGLLSATHRQD
jgi:hypothetical protein